jgi:hypothetical protein
MRQSPWEQVWRQVSVYGNLIQQRVGPIALAIAVGLAYLLTARLSLLLMTQPGVAVFWPAAGVSSGTLIALWARCALASGGWGHCRNHHGQSHGRSKRP